MMAQTFLMALLLSVTSVFAHSPRPCDVHVLHPISHIKVQGWMPLDQVLQSVPHDVSEWDALPVHLRLGMFVNVGMISGVDSQGLTHQLAQKSAHRVKSYPFWPGSHRDFKTGISYMTANSLRLNIITENGKAEIIEGMYFHDGAWVPFLYEFQEEVGRFARVVSSSNGVHALAKCTTCHGTGEDFSPIPFKNKDYQPSKGWFFSDKPEHFTTKNLTSDWAVSDHESLIQSIRGTTR